MGVKIKFEWMSDCDLWSRVYITNMELLEQKKWSSVAHTRKYVFFLNRYEFNNTLGENKMIRNMWIMLWELQFYCDVVLMIILSQVYGGCYVSGRFDYFN